MPAEQSLAAIRTRPEMTVELVAAEPLVVDPVAVDFGADGRLWVAEMHDYPCGLDGKFQPGGRVKTLADTDGDGRYDRATTFLDGLPFPTGVMVWRKGALICAAPDVLYAEDTNGDGTADVVQKLFSGFATHNYQARVNSLQFGLDNWVYAATGLFGGRITSYRGAKVDLTSRDFRVRPETGAIEAVTGQTQQSRVRDDWDNWFGCDSGTLIRHYPLVDRYLRRNPHFHPPAPAVNVADYPGANRLFPISGLVTFKLSGPAGYVTAACGVGIYRDELLGAEFYGNSFTCEPVCQAVHRLVLSPRGATFSGRRAADEHGSEFLASSDNWFRPVQARTGPDGALWIVDMYRYVIEHPIWIPPEVAAELDVRAGDTMGRIYRVFPKNRPPRPIARLDKLDTAGLVGALDSPNGPQRDLAQHMLVTAGDRAAAAFLERLARHSTRPQVRVQALATLDGLGALAWGTVEKALEDEHPGVRRHAIRLTEGFAGKAPQLVGRLRRLADDADPQVRVQLAYTLGAFSGEEAARALAALAVRHGDDEYLVAAAMSSLREDNARRFAEAVLARTAGAEPPPQLMAALLTIDFIAGDGQIWSQLLKAAASGGDAVGDGQLRSLGRLLRARRRAAAPAEPLGPDDRRTVDRLLAVARRRAADEEADPASRLAAIEPLGLGDGDESRGDRRLLAQLLSPQQPGEIQLAAVGQLAYAAGDAAAGELLPRWAGYSPGVRSGVLDVLLGRRAGQAAVLDAIERQAILPGELDAPRRQRLLEAADDSVRKRAEKLLATAGSSGRAQVVAAYAAALKLPGDAVRGEAVFTKACAACHRLDGRGEAVGPDLAALAGKPPQALLTAILDPNQAVDPRYLTYVALTDSGESLSGVLAAETGASIVLVAPDGKEHVLARKEIDQLRSTGRSLMPEGLERDLSVGQMADLLAYLAAAGSAKNRRASAPAAKAKGESAKNGAGGAPR